MNVAEQIKPPKKQEKYESYRKELEKRVSEARQSIERDSPALRLQFQKSIRQR